MSSLIEITDLEELEQLKQLYRATDWPRHCVGYYCLDNFIRWKTNYELISHLNIYTLQDCIYSEGLFIIKDRYQLFIGTLKRGNVGNLERALALMDWSRGYKISSFLECLHSAVLNVIHAKQLKTEYDSLTLMYFMSREQALKLQVRCPNGFYINPLKAEEHATIIDEHWPNRHQGSLFLIKRLINWNPNMGVFKNGTDELVAWCLRLQGGFLGALQVKENYKRLGLGSLVTRAISRLLAQQGDDVMALVNENNIPSRGLFGSLGFAVTDRCYWLRTYPTQVPYEWPNDE